MNDLIFDRTQDDVEYALANPNSEEYLKGAYNYTDLNRLENWVFYFKCLLRKQAYDTSMLNPKVSNKTYQEVLEKTYNDYIDLEYDYYELLSKEANWTMQDIPTLGEMTRIVNNVEALRTMFSELLKEVAYINFDGKINYIQANTLEKILYIINENNEKIIAIQPSCGGFYCGEEEFL